MIEEKQLFHYGDYYPRIHETVFIAPGVKIIGNVKINKNCSIWFNTVIRGDVNFITIDENTNIQDCSVLHVTSEDAPLIIGKHVTVGHKVCLHGCIVKDNTLIGINSVVLDGAVIEEYSMVAAGAVVTPGMIVPKGTLAAGVPAKVIRNLTGKELEYFIISANHYHEYAGLMQKSMK